MSADEALELADELLALNRWEAAQKLIHLQYEAYRDGMDAYDKIYHNLHTGIEAISE